MTERSPESLRSALQRLALYGGGFLGPFGGGIVVSILPEIGDDLGVGAAAAASSLTAYLLPFALVMLVSGTLGARWGRTRTVRAAYAVYLVSSLACFLAPTLPLFLGARVLQGCSNSFTTPLLLAALAASTPKKRLGRALGIFGAFQAAGQSSAPLVGGLAAEIDWRLSFLVIALVAAAFGLIGIPDAARDEPGAARPRLRDALTLPVLRMGVVALLGWGALGGLSFLVAFRAEDVFGLSPTQRGLLLTGFGVAGILTARLVGGVIDRIGARTAVVIGAVAGAVLITAAGTVSLLAVVAVAWFAAGAAGQFILVGVNAAVLGSSGPNRGGAVSVVQALRFTGNALAPITLTPVYAISPAAGFLLPAVLLAVAAPLLMPRDNSSV
ncbi:MULTISPECIES: MFS transporter [Rhodococcus]|uniref:MFS transporter n=1 Tax=Rhodococcus oxybenzonivorans TaxID=1990687 RepID=A0AAE4UXJ2_9NOCA|nr:MULTISPECIES: MFS transporter [Rhodococcus]MDV7242114.1 MFS transporter [Rhodococcus oxybenzonivorans]MDV7264580.1 MFS transporter [Rhodococcus oxybenzonivorans]MDV7276391.1 MFS transporter [Rhodococcus oxybenzonivorans]MDV7331602.1 MFS transporter [Rhodococcus oxybenzonivorans]MDV7343824.1 MFS transporter [Rhodococcus oxybenzonivorans]